MEQLAAAVTLKNVFQPAVKEIAPSELSPDGKTPSDDKILNGESHGLENSNINKEEMLDGTASADRAAERDHKKTRKGGLPILYRIEYEDLDGVVRPGKEDQEPIEVEISPRAELPVLEVVTTIVAKIKDKKNKSDDKEEKPEYEVRSVKGTVLNIHSTALVYAFRKIVDYWPGQSFSGTSITVPEPFSILVYYREKLVEWVDKLACDDHEGKYSREEAFEHVEILEGFLDRKYKSELKLERERHSGNVPVATFEYLWLLFIPGTVVYASDEDSNGNLSAFIVKSVTGGRRTGPSTEPSPYEITLWNLDFDGRYVGRSRRTVELIPYDGEREISDLAVFPEKFHVRDEEFKTKFGDRTLKEVLIERGKAFYDLTRRSYKGYKGETISLPKRTVRGTLVQIAEKPPTLIFMQIEGKVMVDFESFYARDAGEDDKYPKPSLGDFDGGTTPSCYCESCLSKLREVKKSPFAGYDKIDPKEKQELTNDQYLLCSGRVFGFVLQTRSWGKLSYSLISPFIPSSCQVNIFIYRFQG
ncbi:MAG: hypothetical protein M1839_001922 [Geoglossum umbratile]|nr:MAG: hypothetical protein M1839_001922 [Geoglossum umbratile]